MSRRLWRVRGTHQSCRRFNCISSNVLSLAGHRSQNRITVNISFLLLPPCVLTWMPVLSTHDQTMKSSIQLFITTAIFLLGFGGFQKLQAGIIYFGDAATLDTDFPESTRYATGVHAEPLVINDKLRLASGDKMPAEKNNKGSVTIYSDAKYSNELDFISKSLTITFSDVTMGMPNGPSFVQFGLTSSNVDGLSTGNGVYFQRDRPNKGADGGLLLIQSVEGVETVLAKWTIDELPSFNQYYSLSLTLTDKTWSATIVLKEPATGVDYTFSGTFETPWTAKTWGENTFIGLESKMDATWFNTDMESIYYSEGNFGKIEF